MIEAHLAHSLETTPIDSIHAMPADALQSPDVRFWALCDGDTPLACGALKDLGNGLAEVKSVHVIAAARRRGLARRIMTLLESEARNSGYTALVRVTGSELLPAFDAARALYGSLGYVPCDPIPGYGPDPNSVFLRLELAPLG